MVQPTNKEESSFTSCPKEALKIPCQPITKQSEDGMEETKDKRSQS